MNVNMDRLLLLAAGAAVALIADWCVTWWRNSEDRRARSEAEAILKEHGLSSHLYMPGIGIDDPVLHGALDRIAFSGRIVIDGNGIVIGKLMPTVQKGPHLRLVVDNAK